MEKNILKKIMCVLERVHVCGTTAGVRKRSVKGVVVETYYPSGDFDCSKTCAHQSRLPNYEIASSLPF